MSFWSLDRESLHYPMLNKNLEVDTLIIGGGMTGINTMYFLRNQPSVCLVEANQIGSGVSMNTTGKINYLQENTFVANLKKGKKILASEILSSQLYGMKYLLDIIDQEKIDCDLEQVTSYLVTKQEKNIETLKKTAEFLKEKGISVVDFPSHLSERYLYGIGVSDTFVFHPVKYMMKLSKVLKKQAIYEHTKILKIVPGEKYYFCHTENYCIRARNVVIACHYPFFLFPFFMPMKCSIEKSYLIARKVKHNEKYTYITLETPSESMRFYENEHQTYQICLGESHDISMKQDDVAHFEKVKQIFDISEDSIVSSWSNTDLITQDTLPYVGEIKPRLYLATGYQTWGMIQSVVSAKVVSDLLQNKSNDYARLFSPRRKNVDQWIQILVSGFKNTKSLIGSYYFPKSWYSEKIQFSFQNGKLVATFNDEEGEHSVHPICPHMKCGLIFNEIEKTWDCPCHSSRFDKNGKCLKGPSKYSISLDRSEN